VVGYDRFNRGRIEEGNITADYDDRTRKIVGQSLKGLLEGAAGSGGVVLNNNGGIGGKLFDDRFDDV
jgi:hypothetical protein